MSSDKIVIYMNDKRFDGAFEHFVNKVYEAGAASVQKELEATKAELAAERAKPRVGVAWAVKNKMTGTLDGPSLNNGHPNLHETKESAEKWIAGAEDRWQVVPYPIGDGADELRAAIERAEKAEAEVAAWKAAASHDVNTCLDEGSSSQCTPAKLVERISGLTKQVRYAESEMAAMEAQKAAEVPPLDRWRVLATASKVADQMYHDAETLSIEEVAYEATRELIAAMLRDHSDGDAGPYPLKG